MNLTLMFINLQAFGDICDTLNKNLNAVIKEKDHRKMITIMPISVNACFGVELGLKLLLHLAKIDYLKMLKGSSVLTFYI